MVFNKWNIGRNSEKDGEEAVAYEDLHELLEAFCRYRPDAAYCQSYNYDSVFVKAKLFY